MRFFKSYRLTYDKYWEDPFEVIYIGSNPSKFNLEVRAITPIDDMLNFLDRLGCLDPEVEYNDYSISEDEQIEVKVE